MITSYEPHRIMRQLVVSSRLTEPINGEATTVITEDPTAEQGRQGGPREGLASEPGDGVFPLPSPVKSGFSLGDVLQHRLSIREYSREPLTREHLATVLESAWRFQEQIWPGEDGFNDLELQVLALNVEGTDPALYKFEGRTRTLLRLSDDVPSVAAAEELVLQKEFALAGALILVVGDLHQNLKQHYLHGHRELLFRAGFTAHGAWMAAMTAGLVGCVFAGLLPDKLQALGGADGYRRLSLFACAVGRPVDGS